MNGWIRSPYKKTWHQVRNYTCYTVAHSLCGLSWHPKDKRHYTSWGKKRCVKCDLGALMLEIAE